MDTFPFNIKSVLLCLLSTIMFNSVMCSLKVHCNEMDMNALLHFKQGVTDPSGFLSSWVTHDDCCEWKGVKCDNITGRVEELNLPCYTHAVTILSEVVAYKKKEDKSHCLTGEFNLSLLELEFLSYLNLSNNDFKTIQYNSMSSKKCDNLSRGTPFHLCGKSTNLLYLDLSLNYDIFIDNLQWVSVLSSLQYLNLDGVHLHKEIDWLRVVTMLPSLTELHLESCQIENIYPSVQYANFTSLEVLNLADNDFVSELPSWLFNLTCDISHIDLSQNKIHGQLSKKLPNLGSIKSLILFSNYLNGPIPNWLGQLEQLQELDLSSNYFSGPIPSSLGNLSSLAALFLYSNELNGNLPESLGQLFNLETLVVDDNSLTGIVSQRNFLHLSNLKVVALGSPGLIYDFDPNWVPTFQLEELTLTNVHNKLPSWLFTQSSLKVLYIQDSTASFEPLDKLWNFATQLDFFDLENNTINADMSNVMLNSTIIVMVDNNLRGGLPQLSSNVKVLHLEKGSVSGSISCLLCNNVTQKSNLVKLGVRNNLLSGELGNCWNEWKSLVYVDLADNNLTGKIPQSMGSLSYLLHLDLKGNKFFGEVPSSLKNCQKLWLLNLAHNNFSGAIPSWVGQNVKALQLRSNQFNGTIPPQICQFRSLIVIDFANNRLSGPIPNCFHNITAMLSDSFDDNEFIIHITNSTNFLYGISMLIKGNEYHYIKMMRAIDLSSNSLCGTVPLEIYMLIGLQSLNLSHNQLMGTILEEIGNLKQLESIDLSTNHFSGEIPQSMSALSYIGVLNLSFNNFWGKIPSGTQLQGFANLSYIGNHDLCGPPLSKICPQDEKSHNTNSMREDKDDDKSQVYLYFYMGLGTGYAVGFLGVLSAIFFNRTCRHAYFRFLDRLHAMVIQK